MDVAQGLGEPRTLASPVYLCECFLLLLLCICVNVSFLSCTISMLNFLFCNVENYRNNFICALVMFENIMILKGLWTAANKVVNKPFIVMASRFMTEVNALMGLYKYICHTLAFSMLQIHKKKE